MYTREVNDAGPGIGALFFELVFPDLLRFQSGGLFKHP
jgi:hypothetical protein